MTITILFRVVGADSAFELIACRLVEPAMKLRELVKLICRERSLTGLVVDLAVHRLDLIIADRPIQSSLAQRGYNYLHDESGVTVFITAALAKDLNKDFRPIQMLLRSYRMEKTSPSPLRLAIAAEELNSSARCRRARWQHDDHGDRQAGPGVYFFAPTVIATQSMIITALCGLAKSVR